LMGDAGIKDLAGDVEKNLIKVQEKFRLDLSDEEADKFILSLIDESMNAFFPKVIDQAHKWAMYWK
jgi:phosphatidylinositol 3-kinase